MFEKIVDQAIDFACRGYAVRITGPAGSGKTTVFQGVTDELQRRRLTVHRVTALRTQTAVPFSGVLA
ncbi:hypothetical protein [Paenarthrobacter aromaticivorans]|uniref:hypothetical protein n=1 Tax=Paenarthrobacter aromaticivorans TaxID=2849150 RepID=UPI003A804D73